MNPPYQLLAGYKTEFQGHQILVGLFNDKNGSTHTILTSEHDTSPLEQDIQRWGEEISQFYSN
ncbi:MAG: hypothetical protein WC438_03440 [Candidatus Pacearchaeota archaeon]